MKKWLPLLLFLLVPTAFGGLYKWVDADGNIHYTDSPPPQGAEEVTLPSNVTYTPPAPPAESSAEEAEATDDGKYQELVIIRPKMNETIRNNSGEVPVEYSLTPAGLKAGHHFRVILDGKTLDDEFTQEQLLLQQLARGSHTLQIHAVDSAGVPQISSQSVIFFLRRESELDTGSDDSSTTDNSTAFEPDYDQDATEDQSSEYEDTTTATTTDEGITQHQDESDYGTEVTDPEDSRDTVYDPTYDSTTTSGSGDRFGSGTNYSPNYNQQ